MTHLATLREGEPIKIIIDGKEIFSGRIFYADADWKEKVKTVKAENESEQLEIICNYRPDMSR